MSFEPIKIRLASPIMHGEKEISELVFGREMVAGDLRGISVKDMTHDNILEVTSHITGVPTPILQKLKIPDYLEVADVVGDFFGDSLLIGGRE
jgi:hypothetical protein